MNDFSELEAELKQLRPAAPSAELVTRVESALADTPSAGVLPRRQTARVNWFSLGLGVAAAAAALLLLARPKVEQVPQAQPTVASSSPAAASIVRPPRAMVPDGVTRVVYGTRDDGLIFPDNGGQPVRRLRARSRETLQWRDRNTGASLRVSYPTEEVELIPVSGQ